MDQTSRDHRTQRILATVDCIPHGRVATYAQVAREAGLPGLARFVGHVLAALPSGSRLPWHRVITASGHISSRPGPGPEEQRAKLGTEGVRFSRSGRVNLKAWAWDPTDPG
jgi:methylated-DNA-protein-cysteine methyltransferase-like protein